MNCVFIGDSHSSFFSGEDKIQPIWPEPGVNLIPGFSAYHVGPALAYNLGKEDSSTRGGQKIQEVLASIDAKQADVFFCFGEIDCRVHIARLANGSLSSLVGIAVQVVEEYLAFVAQFRDQCRSVNVVGPIGTSFQPGRGAPAYPNEGSEEERNLATFLFNERAKRRTAELGLGFVTVFNDLVFSNLRTKQWLYLDNWHLSQRVMPAFRQRLVEMCPHVVR